MKQQLLAMCVGACCLSGAALPRVAAANCGAEACPIAPNGPETSIGRFSFSLGYQPNEQAQGWNGNHKITAEEALLAEGGLGHVVEQLTRTRAWTLDTRARITDRLQLTLSVPYVDRVHRHALAHHAGFFIESEWHMQGPGDAAALASWTLLTPTNPTANSLVFQVGAKLPTGKTSVEVVNGEQPEPPARPGSGSTDAIVGAQFRRGLGVKTFRGLHAIMPLTASVSARLNGRGTEDYKSGNEWQANVGSAYPLARTVRLLAQVNATSHARDQVGSTDAEAHSTGSVTLLVSPGLQAEIVPGLSAFGYFQFRAYEHTNGPQLVSSNHWSFGLSYTLAKL